MPSTTSRSWATTRSSRSRPKRTLRGHAPIFRRNHAVWSSPICRDGATPSRRVARAFRCEGRANPRWSFAIAARWMSSAATSRNARPRSAGAVVLSTCGAGLVWLLSCSAALWRFWPRTRARIRRRPTTASRVASKVRRQTRIQATPCRSLNRQLCRLTRRVQFGSTTCPSSRSTSTSLELGGLGRPPRRGSRSASDHDRLGDHKPREKPARPAHATFRTAKVARLYGWSARTEDTTEMHIWLQILARTSPNSRLVSCPKSHDAIGVRLLGHDTAPAERREESEAGQNCASLRPKRLLHPGGAASVEAIVSYGTRR